MSAPLPLLTSGDALLLVDVQNDFLPDGALGVAGGDIAAQHCQRYLAHFAAHQRPIVLSRDWHPPHHCSFVAQGGPWPSHCVADTSGAQFSTLLELPANANLTIVSKATTADRDAYSAFEGHAANGTPLHALLQGANIQHLTIGGLATDYCVLATALDARRLGYTVTVLRDAIAAVNVHPDDGTRALQAMQDAGCTISP